MSGAVEKVGVRGAPFADAYSGAIGHRYEANDGRPPFAPQHAHALIFGNRAFYLYDTQIFSTINAFDLVTGEMQ